MQCIEKSIDSENSGNSRIEVPPAEQFLPKIETPLYVKVQVNIKFHKILCTNF